MSTAFNARHELRDLGGIIDHAVAQAQNGGPIDLTGIEQRTEALCVALLRMPSERARNYARDLEHIVHGLDTLHDVLNRQPA
jgi:hypothetical protein